MIEKENPLWFYVTATDTVMHNIKGWIKKETLLPQQWFKPVETTPLYRFEITDSKEVVAVKVIEKATGATRQIITGLNLSINPTGDRLFRTGDYNLDGSVDFRLVPDGEDTQDNGEKATNISVLIKKIICLNRINTLVSPVKNNIHGPSASSLTKIHKELFFST